MITAVDDEIHLEKDGDFTIVSSDGRKFRMNKETLCSAR